MWQYWLIAAGIFFVAEIFTAGFLVFWFGLGALIAMCVSFFIDDLIIQSIVFVVSSAILILATKPLVKKFLKSNDVKTNVFSIVGKKALVIKDIDSIDGKGQIKVDGEVWSAEGIDGMNIEKDTDVEIVKIDGVKAIVKPLSVVSKN